MPLYEYECRECGAVTDIRHGFRETPTERCAKCGGELKRLFNPAGIVFKGSGFYVTDSRKAKGGEGAASSDGGSSSSSSGDGGSSTGSGAAASGSGATSGSGSSSGDSKPAAKKSDAAA